MACVANLETHFTHKFLGSQCGVKELLSKGLETFPKGHIKYIILAKYQSALAFARAFKRCLKCSAVLALVRVMANAAKSMGTITGTHWDCKVDVCIVPLHCTVQKFDFSHDLTQAFCTDFVDKNLSPISLYD